MLRNALPSAQTMQQHGGAPKNTTLPAPAKTQKDDQKDDHERRAAEQTRPEQ
jgi:hypothetical protein